MKKLILATIATIAAFTLSLAHAAELEGFKFDDKIKLGNAELVINGTGVRSKFGKRYAMALYLPAKTGDAKAALAAALGITTLRLELEAGAVQDTPARRSAAEKQRRQQEAEQMIHDDPLVQDMLAQFKTARIVPGSIKPH